ncbi:hypothetical protein, partial [Klebsiella pneumoniae]|uniref:hypothetical protein n=1 Tax=Klebsiella pneumoniae TaxID=573 RepID=UPI00351D63DC
VFFFFIRQKPESEIALGLGGRGLFKRAAAPTASGPGASSSPYGGKKCAMGWRAANRSPSSPGR